MFVEPGHGRCDLDHLTKGEDLVVPISAGGGRGGPEPLTTPPALRSAVEPGSARCPGPRELAGQLHHRRSVVLASSLDDLRWH